MVGYALIRLIRQAVAGRGIRDHVRVDKAQQRHRNVPVLEEFYHRNEVGAHRLGREPLKEVVGAELEQYQRRIGRERLAQQLDTASAGGKRNAQIDYRNAQPLLEQGRIGRISCAVGGLGQHPAAGAVSEGQAGAHADDGTGGGPGNGQLFLRSGRTGGGTVVAGDQLQGESSQEDTAQQDAEK